jgi:hypothetical protein
MSILVWDTREPCPAEFETRWSGSLSRTPHANFSLDPRYLVWEASHGRHARAVLIDEGGREGLLVLREQAGGFVSGWPWRCQAFVAGGDRSAPAGLTSEEIEWLFRHAEQQAGGRRLWFHQPAEWGEMGPGTATTGTILKALDVADESTLLHSMDVNKRRATKQAAKSGFVVVEATESSQFAAYARLQDETETRRGPTAPRGLDPDPAPGESWREWELPWMWLLVAIRDGKIEAGSGFGVYPGGMIDYRTNASSLEGKKGRANVLLAWEAIRLGRERGFRWMNWGGATMFKQEMGGAHVGIACRLGGGPLWTLPNAVETGVARLRTRMGAMLRRGRPAG